MLQLKDQSLSGIVSRYHRAAGIFEKYNLDYCCHGTQSLADACIDKAIPVNEIVNELMPVVKASVRSERDYQTMSPTALIGHILVRHHYYVRETAPAIQKHLVIVAGKHGDRFPWLKEVLTIFNNLKEELEWHMRKEENILFPRIKELEATLNTGVLIWDDSQVQSPIQMMIEEHESAGKMMNDIRRLTTDYTIPTGACTTFALVLRELREFEEDLHIHVHLENYILFPKASDLVSGRFS